MMVASSIAKAPTPRQCDPPASGAVGDLKPALIAELSGYRGSAMPLPLRVTQVLDVAEIPLVMAAVSSGIVPIRAALLVLDTSGRGPCDRLIQEPVELGAWGLIERLRVGGAIQLEDLQQTAAVLGPFHAAARESGS